MTPLVSRRAAGFSGAIDVPGDKSISHRALMLGGLAVGETRIRGLLEGEDVQATAAALRAMGVAIQREDAAEGPLWRVFGRGVGGLAEPEGVLDMGNSGTTTRLLMGILAGHPFTAFLEGDASLRRRPMARVSLPLTAMGASIVARTGGRLPLAITGSDRPMPIEYTLPVASAQVKSAVLLAGLAAPGRTTVIEPAPTRDHSERLLRHFGATVDVTKRPDGGRVISITGQPELTAAEVAVPGDPSSAAFPLVAAALIGGSSLTVRGVGINPLRGGLFTTLAEMGADLSQTGLREQAGEPVADLTLRGGSLRGVEVPPERAPSMIDEYPILAIAAACARGTTVMRGLAELRVKESDRLTAIAEGLAACGVRVEAGPDSLTVHGAGKPPRGGARIAARLDHRMAMAFLVLGMATDEPVAVDDGAPIATSFPGFVPLMNRLGARIEEERTP